MERSPAHSGPGGCMPRDVTEFRARQYLDAIRHTIDGIESGELSCSEPALRLVLAWAELAIVSAGEAVA